MCYARGAKAACEPPPPFLKENPQKVTFKAAYVL